MREIKFRTLFLGTKLVYSDDMTAENKLASFFSNYVDAPETLMQYTGRKTIKGRDLYEGDIVFVEESEPDGDKRYYLVIVWIPEWAMFASLHMDEYHKFLKDGAEALDETMFWTYTIETAEKDFHFAGNIYENPELIDTNGQ